jgi:SAM-dependent methyltransferase
MDDNKLPPFFYEIFDASLPRLNPGDDRLTIRALHTLLNVKPEFADEANNGTLRVMDLGCGNGAQTIQLATHINGTVLAVDNHKPYLDELQRRAEKKGVADKITLYLKDMRDLGLPDGSFDLIWAEGSLFVTGFRKGLTMYNNLLVKEGLLAASELTWLRPDAPAECLQYINGVYPAMVDMDTNLSIITSCGYKVIGHFPLPESAWWEPFYSPLEKRVQALRSKYPGDPEKSGLLDSVQMEIDMYRKYSKYYTELFYLIQRK